MTLTRLLLLGASATLAACAAPAPLNNQPHAFTTLQARSGSTVAGGVAFFEVSGGIRLDVTATGLTPGEHGFHIHDSGDCSAADASSAKGHFNPTGKQHGHASGQDHHGGDMPNLVANAKGEARASFTLPGLSLTGANGIVGRSVVIHADPDDYKSQPAGNSGKRIACGTISPSAR